MSESRNLELLDKVVTGITQSHKAEANLPVGQRRSRATGGGEGGNPLQQHPKFAHQPAGKADLSLNNNTASNPEMMDQVEKRELQLGKTLQNQLGLSNAPKTAPTFTPGTAA